MAECGDLAPDVPAHPGGLPTARWTGRSSPPVSRVPSFRHVIALYADPNPSIMRMRFRRSVLLVVIWLAVAGSLHAQPRPGAAFSFLRLEPSARGAALAGAVTALYGDDVNGLFYNPALLNDRSHRVLSVTYLNHLAGIDAGFVTHARHVEGLGTLGAGIRYVGWGRMDGYDASGDATEDFRATDAALTVGLARMATDRLRYGISTHVITSNMGSFRSSALALDAGVAYRLPENQLIVSASASNVGLVLGRFGDTRDALPLDVRVGVSKRLAYLPLLLSVTGYNLNRVGRDGGSSGLVGDAMRHVVFGGEFQFSEAFNVRFGYNHRRHQDLKIKSRLDMAGLGLGFGIRVAGFGLDYAYNSWSALGGLHQFTLQTGL